MTWRTRRWLAAAVGVSKRGDRAIGFSSSLSAALCHLGVDRRCPGLAAVGL